MKKNKTELDELRSINSHIAMCWDLNIRIRCNDIENGSDISYNKIIKPWVIEQVRKYTSFDSRIIDIGCGCGFLTNEIFGMGYRNVVGIDISKESIEYAQKKYPLINFIHDDICIHGFDDEFDVGMAIMTLNNMPNMELFLESTVSFLKKHGKLIIIIPHPCFWPIKHINKKFKSYLSENSYEITFATKGRNDYPSHVLYFHRPIEIYYKYFQNANYKIKYIKELMEKDQQEHPDIIGFVLEKEI